MTLAFMIYYRSMFSSFYGLFYLLYENCFNKNSRAYLSKVFRHIIAIVYKTYTSKIIPLQVKYCISDYFCLKLSKTIIKLVFSVYNFPISSYTKYSKTQRLIKRNIIKKGMSACGRL